jgi:hypothetical protein
VGLFARRLGWVWLVNAVEFTSLDTMKLPWNHVEWLVVLVLLFAAYWFGAPADPQMNEFGPMTQRTVVSGQEIVRPLPTTQQVVLPYALLGGAVLVVGVPFFRRVKSRRNND